MAGVVPKMSGKTKRGTWLVWFPKLVGGVVKRGQREFSVEEEASEFFGRMQREFPVVGAVGLAMDAKARDEYWSAKARLPEGVSLSDVVEFYIRSRPAGTHLELMPLAEEWLNLKEARDTSAKTSEDRRNKLRAFIRLSGAVRVVDLDPDLIERHLWRMVGEGSNRRQVARKTAQSEASAIRDFCRWLMKRKRLLDTNPMDQVDYGTPETSDPEVLDVNGARSLMKAAVETRERLQAYSVSGGKSPVVKPAGESGRLVPYYALCLFGGMRPSEVERLKPGDFHLGDEAPFIRVEKKKMGRGFRLVPVAPNLLAWLWVYPPKFPVRYFRKEGARVRSTAGLEDSWQADILRHTYISARVAQGVSENEVAREAGTSPKEIHSTYRALMTRAEAEALFDIWP